MICCRFHRILCRHAAIGTIFVVKIIQKNILKSASKVSHKNICKLEKVVGRKIPLIKNINQKEYKQKRNSSGVPAEE